MQERIEAKLGVFEPEYLRLVNESSMHNVPPGSTSHWNLVLVSEHFVGKSLLARQREVYERLASEIAAGIHALTMKVLTPDEWQALEGQVVHRSPECRGGNASR